MLKVGSNLVWGPSLNRQMRQLDFRRCSCGNCAFPALSVPATIVGAFVLYGIWP
jgi:hypothetical protein